MHTAKISGDDYGNTIFAIPGMVDRPSSVGCHALIRDGAILCTSPAELLDDMGWNNKPRQLELFSGEESTENEPAAPRSHCVQHAPEGTEVILAAIQAGHDTLDTLCPALGMPAHELTPQLMRLQVMRCIATQPGGRFVRI